MKTLLTVFFLVFIGISMYFMVKGEKEMVIINLLFAMFMRIYIIEYKTND